MSHTVHLFGGPPGTTAARPSSLLMLGLALILPGCATYQAHPLEPAKMAQSFESRSLQSRELKAYLKAHPYPSSMPQLPGMWNLDTLTLAAFYYSPDLDIARTKWGTALAAVTNAGQRPNPSLRLPFQYTSNPTNGESPWTYGLGLDIPIEIAGKRGYRVAQAQQLSDAARFNIGHTAWQVRSRLRTQLLNLFAATRRATLLERRIAAQQEIVAMLDKRLAMGAATAPEANQQRINLIQSQAGLANEQKLVQDARAGAASAIGLPVSALVGTPLDFSEFDRIYPDIPAHSVRRQAVLNRADLLGALAQYEASQAALQLEVARQYPDLHLGPGYTFDQGMNRFTLPASGISLPLFNRNQGSIDQAEARRREMAANVNALQATALNDIARALANYRTTLDSLKQNESLLTAQKQQIAALQLSFRSGETDRLTFSLAQATAYTNELTRLEALVQVQQAIGLLEDAMQRPLSATGFQTIPK